MGTTDEADRERADPPSTVVVGLLCDPGAPTYTVRSFADDLARDLSRHISEDVHWDVRTRTEALDIDAEGRVPVLELARTLRRQYGWDLLLCVTDLPRQYGEHAVLADLSLSRGAALVSLPALGTVRVRRRLRDTLVYLVGELGRGSAVGSDFGRSRHRAGGRFAPVHWVDYPGPGIEVGLALTGWRGRLRLLAGMVRDNKPWHLVPELSTALAAGFAVAAFGIFYGSIWQLADASSPLRLAMISAAAVGSMITWLIAYNHLWEGRPTSKAKSVLYNLSTVVSLLIGVTSAYLVLFTVTALGALTVITSSYFEQQLGHPVGLADYLTLAWLASSMGTFAGALGSSLESEEAVHRATYSRRERQRRARTREREERREREQRERDDHAAATGENAERTGEE